MNSQPGDTTSCPFIYKEILNQDLILHLLIDFILAVYCLQSHGTLVVFGRGNLDAIKVLVENGVDASIGDLEIMIKGRYKEWSRSVLSTRCNSVKCFLGNAFGSIQWKDKCPGFSVESGQQ